MSFEIFTPKQRGATLEVGVAVMQGNGLTRLHPADLAAVEITRHAVILTDAATQRLALRAPREEDGMREPTITVRRGKSGRTATIGLAGAAGSVGLKPDGVRRFRVERKDGLLILSNGAAVADGAKRPGRKARPR